MIVEFKENKRTLRGESANRKYRYTRRVLLKCEICGVEREVNCTRKIQQSEKHPFNHEIGKYHMPQLEEILAAYSVKSGETYVLEIDKFGNMAILSQADKPSEGATTIPLGSRV